MYKLSRAKRRRVNCVKKQAHAIRTTTPEVSGHGGLLGGGELN